MGIKQYKPTSPGRRISSVNTFEDLTKVQPLRSLMRIQKPSSGRNFQGKITVRHKSGGAKKYYRIIDFKQNKFDIPARVATIEYNPNVSARIALLYYQDGEKRYIIAPVGLKTGDTVLSSKKRIDISLGNRMPLEVIPQGTLLYNVELVPGKGGEIARSAGSGAKLMAIDGDFAHLQMPSSEVRKISKNCLASIGQVSNPDAMHVRLGKAGRMRHLGVRPRVRGKVMNPVDHPHGGGEGNNPIGLKYPKTLWGKHASGVKTRKKSRRSEKNIISRRFKNK
ncbi:MAG: 50S ribosomal protein L2 [Parcubacteria group bacterium GW2011_GWA2_38_13]|nr:MAG: 50S ribosomal protein L2 [Parcubacteria group bacterium GW2011_GWA2_38_13]